MATNFSEGLRMVQRTAVIDGQPVVVNETVHDYFVDGVSVTVEEYAQARQRAQQAMETRLAAMDAARAAADRAAADQEAGHQPAAAIDQDQG